MVDAVSAYDLCVETVRSESRSRYISLAYAPADVRSDLCALFAFEAEIRRIPLIVREPMAGEIRLQWWRDAIAKAESAVPLAAALNETIARHSLPLMAFDSLLDARVSDLYADPPSTTGDAEGHAGETRSVIYQMAVQILRGSGAQNFNDRSGHAGVLEYWLNGLASLNSPTSLRRSFVTREQLSALMLDPDVPFEPARLSKAKLSELRRWMIEEARRHHQAVFIDWKQLTQAERLPYLSLVPQIHGARKTNTLGPLPTLWTIWRSANGAVPAL